MKEIPAAIKYKYPGSWLFKRNVLKWLFFRKYTRQLPFFFQVFSLFIRIYFKFFDYDYCLQGRRMFFLCAYCNNKINRKQYGKILVNNFTIFLDFSDPRFLNIVNELTAPGRESELLSKLLKPGDTFIDIGANHGSFAMTASSLVGAKGLVIALEPQPRLARIIKMTLKENNCSPFSVYETAVGAVDSEIKLFIPADTSGTAGVFSDHSAKHDYNSVTVPIMKFDNLIRHVMLPGRILVKVDIEGSEYNFIIGAEEFFIKHKPVMIIEINPYSLAAAKISGIELKALVEKVGYKYFSEISNPIRLISLDQLKFDYLRNIVLFPEQF